MTKFNFNILWILKSYPSSFWRLDVTINDVPIFKNYHENAVKFLVIQITDRFAKEIKLIVRAAWRGHNDILDICRYQELGKLSLDIKGVGGGTIDIDKINKEICLSSKSTSFGPEPDRTFTTKVLQEAYPDYTVTAS